MKDTRVYLFMGLFWLGVWTYAYLHPQARLNNIALIAGVANLLIYGWLLRKP